MFGQFLKNSFLLFFINSCAGFLHYFYQVFAAKTLPIADLGILNTHLTYFSILMTLGVVTQYFSLFSGLNPLNHRKVWALSLLICAVGMVAVFFLVFYRGDQLEASGPVILFLSAFPGCLTHFWLGRLQKAHRFSWFGITLLSIAAIKFFTVIFATSPITFYSAIFLSQLTGLLISLLGAAKPAPDEISTTSSRALLLASSLSALGVVYFPSYDLLNVRWFFGFDSTGEWSRLALFSKVLYFAPLTLLQVTLPYHLKFFKRQIDLDLHYRIRRIEFITLLLCYAGALALALVGPWVSTQLFRFEPPQWNFIFLACAAIVPLYGLLSSLQIAAALPKPWICVLLVALPLLSTLGAALSQIQSLYGYLIYSTIINTCLGFFGIWITESLLKSVRYSQLEVE